MAFPLAVPLIASVASAGIGLLANELLPEPELELADRLASKRRELFNLSNSAIQQGMVDANELLADTIESKSRGGVTSAAGDLREISRNVNRGVDRAFRQSAAELSRGMIEDERQEILLEYEQDKESRDNKLRAIGSGLSTGTSLLSTGLQLSSLENLLGGASVNFGGGTSVGLQGSGVKLGGIESAVPGLMNSAINSSESQQLGAQSDFDSGFNAFDTFLTGTETDIASRLLRRKNGLGVSTTLGR